MAIFEGAGVALVTPFTSAGDVNFDKLEEILEEQIAERHPHVKRDTGCYARRHPHVERKAGCDAGNTEHHAGRYS